MKKYLSLLPALLLVFSFSTQAQVIITVAGSDVQGYGGDHGAAVSAKLHWPKSVAIDSVGNFYIADAENNCVRKVNTAGIITTIAGTASEAGTGLGNYGGDGAAATLAQLYDPEGVAVDRVGNIYIADANNNRVRKVDTAGIITTVAGSAVAGFAGDGAAATLAQLSSPTRVAVDTLGILYIVDRGNNRIRKVDLAGNISSVAGNGLAGYVGDGGSAATAELNSPADIAADRKGNLYIADQLNECIRKIDASGKITTFAGINAGGYRGDGGAATLAMLFDPEGVAVDDSGNVYIADNGNARIRMVNDTGVIATIAGTGTPDFYGDYGPATAAELWFPQGMAVNANGNLYIADQGNNRIRKIGIGNVLARMVRNTPADIAAYPNPSRGTFTIRISSIAEEQANILITNMAGEKMNELAVTTNHSVPIAVSSAAQVPPGVYFITAVTAHGMSTQRVLVY